MIDECEFWVEFVYCVEDLVDYLLFEFVFCCVVVDGEEL